MIEPQIPDCPRCKGSGVFRGKGVVPTVCTCAVGRQVSTGPWSTRRALVLEVARGRG